MTTTPNANDVLMGGGGAPTAKFANPGDSIRGRIVAPPQAYQERDYVKDKPGGGDLKFYPSGDPIMSVYVDVQTDLHDPSIEDDDGTRRVYIEGRYLKADVRNAVRAAGASGLEVGGTLELTFTHREDPDDKRSRKFWQAKYVPAGNAALMSNTPAQTNAPATAAPAAANPAPAAHPATAPAPTPAAAPSGEDAAAKARQLIALGIDDATIAGATGLGADVVAILRTAA
ncbi:hypothetical protein [Cellulosimicrobium aquatile]|uniref:hypothetical protein n=1 Tax=Cellulosimicrobium aquatile TaxID=1612203 RepID=UPI0014595E81|nr:hypothetical protein [Cellulosimicrobium aquatile]NMF29615.1 hypothetical protein [Cellulosimicrobium aquatile]